MGQVTELPSREEYQFKIKDITEKIRMTKEVMEKTRTEIKDYYRMINKVENHHVSLIIAYIVYIKKEMIIYETMNKLVQENKLLHGFFWSDKSKIQMNEKIGEIQHR